VIFNLFRRKSSHVQHESIRIIGRVCLGVCTRMASGGKPTEGTAPTTSNTREKLSAFKNRASTQYTRMKQV